MELLLLAIGLLVVSAVAALSCQRWARWCSGLGSGGVVVAAALGLVPAMRVLLGAPNERLRLAWSVPYGAFFVELDALSAFFVIPILVLSALAAVYGAGYLQAYGDKKALGVTWFFFNLLVASMALVVLARNGVLFLMAWEAMALASFFLVVFREDERESARDAGWRYLVATHLGTAFLLALFVLLGHGNAVLDFDHFTTAAAAPGVLFVLALAGFGAKAGFVPLHVWLPHAHPAAPSHVSALMSGVMIKTGIYGLLRCLTLLGPPPPWWGWALVVIGITSGIGGVLFAIAQHDLKRLLAYSSVENIGIITLGLGVGVLGVSSGAPVLAVLGFAGALLHVWNHAAFKGLLFLGAGAVAHAAGSRDLDQLGGLLKRMPGTGLAFLAGAVAIAGLPPLNGFASELLLYLAGYSGVVAAGDGLAALPLLAVITALALIGGLAAAAFAKAFGIAFLGSARSPGAAHAHEPALVMRLPMYALAGICLAIGLLAPLLLPHLGPLLAAVSRLPAGVIQIQLAHAAGVLWFGAGGGLALLGMVGLLTAFRHRLLSARSVTESITWDCGYAQPSPRMQYTASSFAQPLTDLFAGLLQTQRRLLRPQGLFPAAAALATNTPDVAERRLFAPVFTGIGSALAALRWLQHGQVHLYVLYVALTLLVLLVWKLG
ncbi:MAG: hypothetical protein HY699_12455 [Deltaproteobacteria bacterium]|nr:hypothetical protein [Deltaproteobacteria bacterium]